MLLASTVVPNYEALCVVDWKWCHFRDPFSYKLCRASRDPAMPFPGKKILHKKNRIVKGLAAPYDNPFLFALVVFGRGAAVAAIVSSPFVLCELKIQLIQEVGNSTL